FASWERLPRGFHAHTEAFRSAFTVGRRRGEVDCAQYGWQPRNDVLASSGGPCAAVLVYTVRLVKPGALLYTYQYTDADIIFQFQGSPKCLKRPPCTSQDYYEIDSACDENNQTRAVYRWVEPQICREDLNEAVSLPSSGELKTCPPCNPGMHFTSGSGCVFCPRDQHSDGVSSCKLVHRAQHRTTVISISGGLSYRLEWLQLVCQLKMPAVASTKVGNPEVTTFILE
ncbi:hypothetical protein Avbf_14709, partial [Armadillidium vulgare]